MLPHRIARTGGVLAALLLAVALVPALCAASAPLPTVRADADLSITKTALDEPAPYPGDVLTFTLTLANDGPDTATGIVVTDSLLVGLFGSLTPVDTTWAPSAGSVGYEASANTLTWSLDSLAAGGTATLTFAVLVGITEPGTYSNTAAITATDATDSNADNDTATYTFEVQAPVDLREGIQIQALALRRNVARLPNVLVGTYNFGVYRRLPAAYTNGPRWAEANDGIPQPMIINDLLVTQDRRAWAATWGLAGIYVSDNGGRSWRSADFPEEDTTGAFRIVYALAEDQAGHLYASAGLGIIYRLMAGDSTWHAVGTLPGGSADTPWSLAAHPTKAGVLYGGTFGNGVYRSEDFGVTWTFVGGEGLGADGRVHVFDLEFDPAFSDTTHLWAATAIGVYRTTDDGATWEDMSTDLTVFREARALAFRPRADRAVFVSIWGDGVKRMPSRLEPGPWDDVPGLLPNTTALLMDDETDELYAATDDGDLLTHLSGDVSTGVVPADGTTPEGFVLGQNYPNPFNPATTITFTLPDAMAARLVLYDLLGREVRVLLDRPLAAGTHALAFDAPALPSGLYIYRLETAAATLTRTLTLVK